MTRHVYSIGDTVVLKDGPVRLARSNGACKVLATLPETGGSRQYRVRFESESFDRCIAEADIDSSRSKASARAPAPANTPKKESTSWLKANSVRTAK
ncbi:MAG: cold-shock protein [Allorhizobium sp.]